MMEFGIIKAHIEKMKIIRKILKYKIIIKQKYKIIIK